MLLLLYVHLLLVPLTPLDIHPLPSLLPLGLLGFILLRTRLCPPMVALHDLFYVLEVASLPLQSFLAVFLPFLRLGRFLVGIVQIELVDLHL